MLTLVANSSGKSKSCFLAETGMSESAPGRTHFDPAGTKPVPTSHTPQGPSPYEPNELYKCVHPPTHHGPPTDFHKPYELHEPYELNALNPPVPRAFFSFPIFSLVGICPRLR